MTTNNQNTSALYKEFQKRFKLLASKRKFIVENTLSNIFTMRLIGNKTHGDMAEIGIAEFIHQFMYDFDSRHVGKDLFRAKEHEEDIIIINELTNEVIPVSLKAYGDGPLQLSTDKDSKMFPKLCEYGNEITDAQTIRSIFKSEAFLSLNSVNVMPLIYREHEKKCNIMVFDFDKMKRKTKKILFVDKGQKYDEETQSVTTYKGRSHPIYMFVDGDGKYICEVRYGNASANALQRGFWTHTQNAINYFDSLTNGWISYEHNLTLVQLFRLALNSTEHGHKSANAILQTDIDNLIKSDTTKFNL
ncbi:MAG: hypothetical protein IJ528_00965 [Bacteroidaceae bacterium]|nr:hypothetical protein [Bacteroidaceae bacterium]